MDLKVEIRRNSDGIIAVDLWKDWEYSEFWWSDGNAACDCNRSLFFSRARGEEEKERECGMTLYSVRLSDASTGEVLYDEFSDEDEDEDEEV